MHEGNFEAAADLEAVPLARLLCIQHQNRKSATDGAATSALGQQRTLVCKRRNVRFGPEADVAAQRAAHLLLAKFDHSG